MKLRLLLIGLLFASLAACGGGVGEGGTGSFSLGPISGFGSVIVNGVRFDDTTADIRDDDDAVRRRDELRLGMVVAIDSTRIDLASGRASARSIRIGSEIVGRVSAVNPNGSGFMVFGLPVLVIADTIFDEQLVGGITALQPGDVVEVYGFFNRFLRVFVATRVELKAVGTAIFKLRAPIEAIDNAARTITLGGLAISTANVSLPAGLLPGVIVRVRAQLAGAGLVATRVDIAALQIADRDDVRVEARITSFASSRSFAISGLPVDASGASFPDGEAGVVLGARVEVEGAVVGGILIANKVKPEDATPEFRLIGTIAALNTPARTFVVQGVTVHYPAGVRIDNGTEAGFADGRAVEVRGIPFAGGTRLLALRIILDP